MKSIEHDHQVALFNWAKLAEGRYPDLALLFAIPNGGKRDVRVAMRMKAEGVRAGVPDLMLSVARNGYHGLFVEMKIKPNRISQEQNAWLAALSEQGYATSVCWSWDEAREVIEAYLGGVFCPPETKETAGATRKHDRAGAFALQTGAF